MLQANCFVFYHFQLSCEVPNPRKQCIYYSHCTPGYYLIPYTLPTYIHFYHIEDVHNKHMTNKNIIVQALGDNLKGDR